MYNLSLSFSWFERTAAAAVAGIYLPPALLRAHIKLVFCVSACARRAWGTRTLGGLLRVLVRSLLYILVQSLFLSVFPFYTHQRCRCCCTNTMNISFSLYLVSFLLLSLFLLHFCATCYYERVDGGWRRHICGIAFFYFTLHIQNCKERNYELRDARRCYVRRIIYWVMC